MRPVQLCTTSMAKRDTRVRDDRVAVRLSVDRRDDLLVTGLVCQKDFGTDTARIAGSVDAYDPDNTWPPVAGSFT